MVEYFSIFFTSVSTEIQDNIPPTKKNFKNYLKTWNKNKFIFETPEEISDVIQTLKLNKSTGPNNLSG